MAHFFGLFFHDLGAGKGDFFTSDMSLEDADRVALQRSITKKFVDYLEPGWDQRAIDSFIADNDACRDFQLQPNSWFDDYVIGGVKTLLGRWLFDDDGCPPTLRNLTDMSRCGPGSAVGIDLPAFYTKLFGSTLTTTNPDLWRLYRAAISANPTWFRAEEVRESLYGNEVVMGSKISVVLKQLDIGRTICSEAVLDMFFQLGIGEFIVWTVLMPLGINLSTQPAKNRELARKGSIDGSIATVDLRSASNRIARILVELFPVEFARWLLRTRAKAAQLPSGKMVELHMLCSMGNGYCFPLQTMLFASIVCTVYDLLNLKVNFGSSRDEGFLSGLYGGNRINAGVFGDDIAVLTEAYSSVVRALELFGFVVNREKSFSTGPFRESCGHDYFRGVNIRGVYLKTLVTRESRYSAINRLVKWSTKTGINLDNCLSYALRNTGFTPVPYAEADDLGVKVPKTWSGQWYSISSQGSSQLYWVRSYGAEAYRYEEDPYGDMLTIRGKHVPFNRDGYTVSYVAGYIRGGLITLRSDREDGTATGKVRVLLRSVPNWDHIPQADVKFELRDHSWEATIERVLRSAFPLWRFRII